MSFRVFCSLVGVLFVIWIGVIVYLAAHHVEPSPRVECVGETPEGVKLYRIEEHGRWHYVAVDRQGKTQEVK